MLQWRSVISKEDKAPEDTKKDQKHSKLAEKLREVRGRQTKHSGPGTRHEDKRLVDIKRSQQKMSNIR